MTELTKSRLILFKEYWKELSKYDPKMLEDSERKIIKWAKKYLSEEKCHWIDIRHGKEVIGFVIISESGGDCHPDVDYSINQAYVKPSHRNLGYMSGTVLFFLDSHRGLYSYDVLHGNDTARRFWLHIFDMLYGKPIRLDEVREDVGNLELFGFEI